MPTRQVVKRVRRAERVASTEFQFTREMNPVLSGAWETPAEVRDYYEGAWAAFQELPMPVNTDEPWRRTDLRGLRAGEFRLPAAEDLGGLPAPSAELLKPLTGKEHGGQISIEPLKVSVDLAPELAEQGVIFTDWGTALQKHGDLLASKLNQIVRPTEGKFAALAASMAQTGVFVYIPRGVQVEEPLHSILWGPGAGLAYFSHILVWLEDGASLTYVHEAASPTEDGGQTLHAGIMEVYVGAGANLRLVELQSWGEHVWNFAHSRARVDRDGKLDWIFGAIGSHLTKAFSDLDLAGQGSWGRMSGFYFTDGDQHLDHDTQQNHLAPDTTSDLLFKGALKDESRSVWQGMIYVAPGAQKTDGYQANRNLVLSRKARADSIPGLEILADDVRCTHGATVGKIDPDEVFYLRSRGIPYDEAERLIVEGFFDPIMQRIPFEGVRSRFQDAIQEKMG